MFLICKIYKPSLGYKKKGTHLSSFFIDLFLFFRQAARLKSVHRFQPMVQAQPH